MTNYKSLIAPFVAMIAIILQLVFDVELPEGLQSSIVDSVANLVAVGVVVYGILHNHFKNK